MLCFYRRITLHEANAIDPQLITLVPLQDMPQQSTKCVAAIAVATAAIAPHLITSSKVPKDSFKLNIRVSRLRLLLTTKAVNFLDGL
ncbi:hypothetical protein P8452_64405 [Trifolium repens]|nr:hypothetical protein P8452_64405 [Trifolium repens]